MGDHIQKLEAEAEAEKPFNAADPKQVNNARKKASRQRSERLRVINALMQHVDGRKWVYELLARCHIYSNPFVPGQPDTTAHNCGEKNIGLMILADVLAAAPDEYLQMCKENAESK